MRAPFVSSRDSVSVRPLILLALQGADGVWGRGEAAPLAGYDGVGTDAVRGALEDCLPLLAQSDGREREQLLARCSEQTVLPQALAVIDMALWDLAGRRAGKPVWRLLGAASAAPVQVSATIAVPDRAGAAAQAAAAVAAGFPCVKVKVGLGDDAGRIAAVRAAAGPDLSIRLDANGAWSVDEALASLRMLQAAGVELCEEPVSGLDDVARLSAKTLVPLALDESATAPGALQRRVCDAVCLKVTSCGGISGVLRAASQARQAGYEVYLASTLDGPLGIAAALHAAVVIRPDRACGLATLSQFAGSADPLPAVDGAISPPPGPGLGDGLLAWYRPA